MKKPTTRTGVRKVKGWGHLEMVRNEVFRVFIGEKPECPHGKDFGLECIIPVTITYKLPLTKQKK